MIKKSILIITWGIFCLCCSCNSQEIPTKLPPIEDVAFSDRLKDLLKFSVPVIGVQTLAKEKNAYLIVDTREKEEYAISHIPGAKFGGYKDFNWKVLENVAKDQPIVLYCSVGYRSEKIGEKLKKAGFVNIYNLYGSIFEWANEDLPLENAQGEKTREIHTYNSRWSKWVEEGELIKVW